MAATAIVRVLAGRQLEARVRQHRITTDRSSEEGGTDRGPTSGELLLAAIGSCATGGVRNFLHAHHASSEGLQTQVSFVPADVPGARDKIRIEVALPPGGERFSDNELRAAATQGRVVSRVQLGSEMEVLIQRRVTQATP